MTPMQRILSKFLSRKFIISLLAIIFVTFCIDVTAEAKLGFVGMIVGFYFHTNKSEKQETIND